MTKEFAIRIIKECKEKGFKHTFYTLKEYDTALEMAIKALEQTRWIPVKFRPFTKEEQKEYPDYCYMADCLMPSEDEEILVSTTHGTVEKDIAGFEDGFYLDSGYDWQTDIVAWMPLPEPYRGDGDTE